MQIPPRHLLVPTDFSDCANAALDYAIALATPLGGRVTVLHAYELPIVGFPDGALVASAEIASRIATAAQQALDAAVAKHRGGAVPVEAVLKVGDPREMILEIAGERAADAIVMGTHGRHGLAHALLGSVAERVVRTSKLPVVTVHKG